MLNALTAADVYAEDQLFATLDPTTRRFPLPNGKDVLVTDTVGFIQNLPTELVAAFRATLEEIVDSTMLVHVVDISSPLAGAQVAAVDTVLKELGASDIPRVTVWNKSDASIASGKDPEALAEEARRMRRFARCAVFSFSPPPPLPSVSSPSRDVTAFASRAYAPPMSSPPAALYPAAAAAAAFSCGGIWCCAA